MNTLSSSNRQQSLALLTAAFTLLGAAGCVTELDGPLPGGECGGGDGFVDDDCGEGNNAPNNEGNNTPNNEGNNADPCSGVVCGEGASCENGACVCAPGFISDGDRCVAPDPSDPALRTEEMVCERWNADYGTNASVVWHAIDAADMCDAGEIDSVAHDDAMRRLNLYRWLVGLGPAGVSEGAKRISQQAAMMMDVNNSLSHNPPQGWTCYNEEGARAAGSSNLALGYSNAADSVDGYMRDRNTPSLGHRRWCLFPQLDDVGFGHRGRGGAMQVFNRNNAPNPEFVAYPAPGPFPADAILGVWSFSAPSLRSPQVTITAQSSGETLSAEVTLLQANFGLDTVAIAPGFTPAVGETYRLEVISGGDQWVYETTLVSCQ